MLILPQITLNLSKLLLDFLLSGPHKSTVLDFEITIFNDFFFFFEIFKFPVVPYGENEPSEIDMQLLCICIGKHIWRVK